LGRPSSTPIRTTSYAAHPPCYSIGPGRESEQSFPSSVEVKNGWSGVSAFMLWAGNIHLLGNSTNCLLVPVGRASKTQVDNICNLRERMEVAVACSNQL